MGTLGTGSYTCRLIRRRLGSTPAYKLGQLKPTQGQWGRAINKSTTATVSVQVITPAGRKASCQPLLRDLDPDRDELELFRDREMVWAGRVESVIADPDQRRGTITATDLSKVWGDRVITDDFVYHDTDLATIFDALLTYAYRLDDPGVFVSSSPSGILGDRIAAAKDLKPVVGEITDLVRAGVDWTFAGRTFWVGGTVVGDSNNRIAAPLTDRSFRKAPQTRRTSVGMVLEAFIRGNNVVGHYGGPAPDGLVIQKVSNQSSATDQASVDASARSWWERAHEPLVYVEGQSALSPQALVEMNELIPGLLMPIRLSGAGIVPIETDLRLQSLNVTFDTKTETVTPMLQPAGETFKAAIRG